MSLAEYKGVWVFVEQVDKKVQKVSLELLGEGKRIADKLNTNLTAVVLGSGVKDEAKLLVAYGADDVIVVEDERLKTYTTEPYAKVLSNLINDKKPEIVLVGATALGRDLAPRVSARVHTGLTADCTTLEVEEVNAEGVDAEFVQANLMMTRPAFGGNIMATIVCPDHRPQMATVRPGVMKMLDRDDAKKGNIEEVASNLTDADVNVKVLEVVVEDKKAVNIEDANILISGGRGVGSKENFEKLHELAEVLGATVSGSRAAVDAGYIEQARQVGQTGKTVRPEVYVACGISGAIQHVAGMEESDFIIAINKNDSAPIFEVADIGIVGDVAKVVPAFKEELQSYLTKRDKQ